MPIKSLNDLFVHTLKDIYFAENHIKKALPKMIENADDGKLRGLLEDHLDETIVHIERLAKAFESIGEKVAGEKCPAIVGIVDETEELMSEIEDANTRDAALIGAAQAIEHYEITRYGTLCVWAKQLGYQAARNLLEENLSEDKDADSKLTQIAEGGLNKQAAA